MKNKQILAILSSSFFTLAFIALLLGQKVEQKSNDAIFSQDDFDYTVQADLGQISALSLADELIKQENFYWLIDFRDSLSYNQYHIPTSINLSLEQLLKNDLKINNKIYLLDYYEEKAIQAYYLLNIRGFYDVHFLKGGMTAWKNDVLFPEKSSIPAKQFEKRKAITDFFAGQIQSEKSTKVLPKKNDEIKKLHSIQIGC